MTKSQRLKPLAKLAKDDEHSAARVMSECQRRLDAQRARLDDLMTYRQEYDNKLYTTGRSGMEVAALQRYRTFLARLDEVIAMQAEVVERVQEEYDQKNSVWSDARARHKSLDKAVAHHRSREAARHERREQQQNDERAQTRGATTKEEVG